MKFCFTSLLIIVAVFLLFPPPCVAQPGQGSWVFSLSGSGGSISAGGTYQPRITQRYGMLNSQIGIYIWDFLCIAPEVQLISQEDQEIIFAFSGAIEADIPLEKAYATPFAVFSWGKSNGIIPIEPYYSSDFITDGPQVTFLQLGGGIKYYLSEQIGFRGEYRYQRYSFNRKKEEHDRLFLGIILLF